VTQNTLNSSTWFVCPRPNARADARLFLFPYAGGAPSAFHSWVNEIPSNIETHIAHYPGRGSRYNEPLLNNINTLVERIYDAIQPLLDKPFFFMGHSMGGIVAFELAQLLQRHDLHLPQILFVSACGAPHIPDPHPSLHKLPDLEFIRSLRELNGIPAEVTKHSELMQLLLPTLRADFELIESYHYSSSGSPLNCPIIAFGGLDDPRVSQERLEGWFSHTLSRFASQYFPGDHFFINSEKKSILRSIAIEITSFSLKK